MRIKILFINITVCFLFDISTFSQNIGVNTDGTSAESGTMLDVKGTNPLTTTATQTVFQIKSYDANGLKMRMILGTNVTVANTYGALEVYDAVNVAYRSLALQPNGGYVGIGTTSPNYPLTFPASNGAKINLFQNNNWGFGIQTNLLQIFSPVSTTRVGIGYGSSSSFTETMSVIGGNVGIGTTSPSGALHVLSAGVNYVQRASNNSNEGACFIFQKARGTTTVPTAIQNGDEIAKWLAGAYDGTQYLFMGGISTVVTGVVSTGNIPIALVFGVDSTSMGNPSNNEAMRILSSKNVGIGTTSPQVALHVLSPIFTSTSNLHPYRSGMVVEGDQNTFGGRISIRQAASNPSLTLFRTNGTIASPTATSSGDWLGSVAFGGYDGSVVNSCYGLIGMAAENWTTSNHGMDLTFYTINKLAGWGGTEKMRLTSEGALAFNGSTNYGTSGQVLTSNGNAPPTWANGPTASGSGNMVLLYTNETSVSGTLAAGSVFTYTVPANTYSYVMVESDIEADNTGTGKWQFELFYAGTLKHTASLYTNTTDWLSGSVSYMQAMTAGGVVRIDVVKQATGNNWYVRNFRVYGIY